MACCRIQDSEADLGQFLLFTLMLALLLFLPLSWVLWYGLQRGERRRRGRDLSEAEVDAALGRARWMTLLCVLALAVVAYLGLSLRATGG